jgi:hypothetical protein
MGALCTSKTSGAVVIDDKPIVKKTKYLPGSKEGMIPLACPLQIVEAMFKDLEI